MMAYKRVKGGYVPVKFGVPGVCGSWISTHELLSLTLLHGCWGRGPYKLVFRYAFMRSDGCLCFGAKFAGKKRSLEPGQVSWGRGWRRQTLKLLREGETEGGC